jgi:hypothetical protein
LKEKTILLGYTKGADGSVAWSVVPLRLTAQGHRRRNLLGEYDFSDEKLKDTAGIRLPKIAT